MTSLRDWTRKACAIPITHENEREYYLALASPNAPTPRSERVLETCIAPQFGDLLLDVVRGKFCRVLATEPYAVYADADGDLGMFSARFDVPASLRDPLGYFSELLASTTDARAAAGLTDTRLDSLLLSFKIGTHDDVLRELCGECDGFDETRVLRWTLKTDGFRRLVGFEFNCGRCCVQFDVHVPCETNLRSVVNFIEDLGDDKHDFCLASRGVEFHRRMPTAMRPIWHGECSVDNARAIFCDVDLGRKPGTTLYVFRSPLPVVAKFIQEQRYYLELFDAYWTLDPSQIFDTSRGRVVLKRAKLSSDDPDVLQWWYQHGVALEIAIVFVQLGVPSLVFYEIVHRLPRICFQRRARLMDFYDSVLRSRWQILAAREISAKK